jgi:DNA-binding IclR family transcriptional regulator
LAWTLVTNHGAVLILVAREGAITAERIAFRLGLAVRSVQRILADLEEAGYISKHKEGRANRYEVDLSRPMRRQGLETLPLGEVFGAFLKRDTAVERI